ncbi:MAG: signal recognition particle protein, partial [Rhodobiaceae bacterium]|nr:signal recognition particle protein [Rhodobiaceae bacterium]
VSLVEKAAAEIDQEKAAAMAKKLQKGAFDLEDLADQMKQMQKMGGMSGLMGLLPGVGKIKKQMDAANLDNSVINRQIAIIQSMTPHERKKPDVIKASRRKRIAAGSGTEVQDVNRLLKMHRQMSDMMKKMGRRKGGLAGLFGGGAQPDPAALEEMAKQMPGGLPGGMGGGLPGQLPPGLGGLGGGMPGLPKGMGGLPGLPGLPGKKK